MWVWGVWVGVTAELKQQKQCAKCKQFGGCQ